MDEKLTKIIEEVKNLSVLELSQLVKAFEEEFGIEIPDEDAEKIRVVKDAVVYIDKKVSK